MTEPSLAKEASPRKDGFWAWLWHGFTTRARLLKYANFKEWFSDYEHEGITGFCIALFGWFAWFSVSMATNMPLVILLGFPTCLFGILIFLHAEYRSEGDC